MPKDSMPEYRHHEGLVSTFDIRHHLDSFNTLEEFIGQNFFVPDYGRKDFTKLLPPWERLHYFHELTKNEQENEKKKFQELVVGLNELADKMFESYKVYRSTVREILIL